MGLRFFVLVVKFLNLFCPVVKIYGNVEKKLYGIHWIASFSGCRRRVDSGKLVIDDAEFLCGLICDGLVDIGANIFSKSVKQFYPQGATVLIGITESHASAHSWPEDGFMEFDFNTCNLDMDGNFLLDYIGKNIGASGCSFMKIMRYEDGSEISEKKDIFCY